jgi:hypothetical protein
MLGAEPLSRPSAPPPDAPAPRLLIERRPIAAASLPAAVLLLFLAVWPAALLVRWNAIDRFAGRLFEPYPDVKEYLAGAQAIRQTGRFFLQVGPYEAPPRYPPGWSMVLAPALELGIPPQRAPEIAAAFDAIHALLIAVATAFFCRWLRGSADAWFHPGDLFAGMIAGWGWAFTPIAVSLAVFAQSDAPAAAVLDAMFLLLLVGVFRRNTWWTAGLVFFTAGGLLGLAVAMRPVVLPVAAGSLVLLLAALALNSSRRLGVLSVISLLVGAAIPVACAATLMSRSGWGAWNWSHYAYWVPQFNDLGAVFRWRHLTEGFADVRLFDPINGQAFGHLELALHLFLGFPLGKYLPGMGPVWPTLAWLLGGAITLERALRSSAKERSVSLLVIGAFVTWILSHLLLFGTYFYPGTRFYLPPLALAWVLLGGFTVHLVRHASPVWRAVALATLALTAISVKSELENSLSRDRVPSAELNERDVLAPFRSWLMTPDLERRELPVPFDPVRAQAMGLLSPATMSRISAWGELPETEHTWPLKARGILE